MKNATHVGRLCAAYKKALQHIGAADVVVRAGASAAYARRLLSANGFTKSGDVYRVKATKLLATLGLDRLPIDKLLTNRFHHTIFDRNAAMQAALWTLSFGGNEHRKLTLDAVDEPDAEGRLFTGHADGAPVATMRLYATAPRQYTITPPAAIGEERANTALLAALLKCALDDVVNRDAGATLVMHATDDPPFAQVALRRAGFTAGRRGARPRFVALTTTAAALRRRLGLDRVSVSDVLRLRISAQAIDRCGELLSMLAFAANWQTIHFPPPVRYREGAAGETPFTAIREGIVFVEGLLAPAEQRKLFGYVRRSRKRFYKSTVIADDGSLKVERNYRSSRVITNVDGIRPLLERKIVKLLPALKRELSISRANPRRIEMQITASNDGDLFRRHTDNGGAASPRRLSYVYFFFEEPRRFRGGELCFYDWQSRRILTIRPKNNTIVFFRSERLHEVLRVRVPSRRFEHSRFTANGWVRR